MASGFQLRTAAATAINSIEFLRQFVGPNVDPIQAEADKEAFRRVEAYLTGIVDEPGFQDAHRLTIDGVQEVRDIAGAVVSERERARLK